MAGCAAALGAVAGNYVAQRAFGLEGDGTAEAGTGMDHRSLREALSGETTSGPARKGIGSAAWTIEARVSNSKANNRRLIWERFIVIQKCMV